jgi:hypothetical protein
MKIALCFIISYDHILNKEHIWREWIESNADIINVYFYYKELKKIKSKWILEHTIPPKCIYNTTYYHMIPAYMSIMTFAYENDTKNQWFCFLTDSCCPIISPKRFRYLFFENYNKTIMNWRKAWWNIDFHKRGNLARLPEEMRLANDPWFVLKREHVNNCIQFFNFKSDVVSTICSGGLANESLFGIILYCYKQLEPNGVVLKETTHLTDWSRMSSATSPYVFKYADESELDFIYRELNKNKYAMFIRKMAPQFPDEVLNDIIYKRDREKYNENILSKLKIKNTTYHRILLLFTFIVLCSMAYLLYFI